MKLRNICVIAGCAAVAAILNGCSGNPVSSNSGSQNGNYALAAGYEEENAQSVAQSIAGSAGFFDASTFSRTCKRERRYDDRDPMECVVVFKRLVGPQRFGHRERAVRQ